MVSETKGRLRPAGLRLPAGWVAAAKAAPGAFAGGALSLAGAAIILGLAWAAAAAYQDDLPGPLATMGTFWNLVSNPFYDNGPNDKGIGLQLMASLGRVFKGFVLAAAVAIPVGILLGLSPMFRRVFDPIVQILRPVSPLAWFPIGLVALQSAPSAAIFVVFIARSGRR